MTFDSRSFIKPAVNSRHLYWASALSVEVVITLSTWLNQSNVLYRNFIGAVSFIVANWLFGCFENEQVLFIFMSALQNSSQIFPSEQLKLLLGHYMLLGQSIQKISLSRRCFLSPAPNCCGGRMWKVLFQKSFHLSILN